MHAYKAWDTVQCYAPHPRSSVYATKHQLTNEASHGMPGYTGFDKA